MANDSHKTAAYKVVPTSDGRRYRFFCDLSGCLVCETEAYAMASPEEELEKAWLSEGKKNFNLCHKCGRWVDTVMFNADVLECVDCAPWENDPKYCPFCGKKVTTDAENCAFCGKRLLYGAI